MRVKRLDRELFSVIYFRFIVHIFTDPITLQGKYNDLITYICVNL